MLEYTVRKIKKINDKWNDIDTAKINIYKWRDNGYHPKAAAQLCYDDENLYVRLEAYETKIRAEHKNLNDSVCEDSCLEFFFKPAGQKEYINIEMNSIGTMLIGIGADRNDRKALTPDLKLFDIKPSVNSEKWWVEYKIPFTFMKEVYGDFKIKDGFMGNFYKCGDNTEFPHFGMWNEVINETEDFHKPEYFAPIYIG